MYQIVHIPDYDQLPSVKNLTLTQPPPLPKPTYRFRFSYRVGGKWGIPKSGNLRKKRIETHVEIITKDNEIQARGKAVKIPGDQFNKEVGRRLALRDAMDFYLRSERIPIWNAYQATKVSQTPPKLPLTTSKDFLRILEEEFLEWDESNLAASLDPSKTEMGRIVANSTVFKGREKQVLKDLYNLGWSIKNQLLARLEARLTK